MVKRLKQEIKALREEVGYLREQLDGNGEGEEGKQGTELAEHEIRRLREQVQLYVDQRITDPTALLTLGGSPNFTRVHTAFRLLREIGCALGGSGGSAGSGSGGGGGGSVADSEELLKLKNLLDHRDNEISILVNMVKRGKTVPPTNFDSAGSSRGSSEGMKSTTPSRRTTPAHSHNSSSGSSGSSGSRGSSGSSMPPVNALVLADKRKSFDLFRQSYNHNSAIEENKTLLRTRYDLAKEMGKKIPCSRSLLCVVCCF